MIGLLFLAYKKGILFFTSRTSFPQMDMEIAYKPEFLRILFGLLNRIKDAADFSVISDDIIKIIFIFNRSSHVASHVFFG